MAKSEYVLQLDGVQAAVHAKFRTLGFRKSGRSHNRNTAQGLLHVVTFQMGSFPIGYVIPGFRDKLYGQFAVNLGVLLPCVQKRLNEFPIPQSVADSHCSIRDRLREPIDGRQWFRLGEDSPAAVVDLLELHGLPFLEQFESYQDVLSYFEGHGDLPFLNHGRACLEMAVVAREIGNIDMSNRLFDQAYDCANKPSSRAYIARVAERLGHAVT
ncbi:MAG: DUF4304 domain-containing protein [Tepidisphaeraceae bacterium]|jgi:hypothetical protein